MKTTRSPFRGVGMAEAEQISFAPMGDRHLAVPVGWKVSISLELDDGTGGDGGGHPVPSLPGDLGRWCGGTFSPCQLSFTVEEGSGEKMEHEVDLGELELARVPTDGTRNE